jgi:hypothetical protein
MSALVQHHSPQPKPLPSHTIVLLLPLMPLLLCLPCCFLQEDPHDDYSHLLQDLSGGEGLQESTDLIWGSSDELAATNQAGSSCSDSVLQAESPMVSKVGSSVHPAAAARQGLLPLLLLRDWQQKSMQCSRIPMLSMHLVLKLLWRSSFPAGQSNHTAIVALRYHTSAQGTKRAAQSEDDLDSAHSLKRLCSNTMSSQPHAPPQLVIDVNQSIATGISPRLVGVEELGLLSLRNAAGAAGADLGMWSVLQEVGSWGIMYCFNQQSAAVSVCKRQLGAA